MRLLLAAACLALSACADLNWQETYNNAARADCRENVDADTRRACLDKVEANASAKREATRP